MADPDHIPDMDGLDRLTVALYRAGLGVSAFALLLTAGGLVASRSAETSGRFLLFLGVALIAADLHLYDKRVRWVIGALAWTCAALLALAVSLDGNAAHVVRHASVGFGFTVLSAVALKERLCFRIPGLVATPVFLAASLVPLLLGWNFVAAIPLGVAGVVLAWLTIAKVRQPFHFDIGDKSRYGV